MASTQMVTIPGATLGSIPLANIEVGERFRKDYGDLFDLISSIEKQGLINPISVTPSKNDPDHYVLVAGGRRLEAMRRLSWEQIPVRVFPEPLTELDLRILELAENLQRKDMSWQEQNNLQRRIHLLQQAKHGPAVKGSVDKVGWSIEDTAKMLGVSESQVKQSIKLADKFDKYSAVLGDPKKYRTESDAKKAVKEVEEALIRAELAKRAAKRENSSSLFSLMEQRYQIGDAIEKMAELPSESFDFCECDPPYGIVLDEVKNSGVGDQYHELDAKDYIVFNAALLRQIYRVLKKDSFCVFWFSIEPWIETLYKLAIEADFTCKRTPLIWTKKAGQALSPSTTLSSAYETALILRKGQPILAKPGRINVFDFAPTPACYKHHPTQKPLELYQEIFNTFSFEGASCISPFAGSGAALIAAQLSMRKCVGFDLSEEYKKGYLKMVSETFVESK